MSNCKPTRFVYSERHFDDHYEYRGVWVPQDVMQNIPSDRLLHEDEWRAIGVVQSRGWEHYRLNKLEPLILCFRRPKGANNRTGRTAFKWEPASRDSIPRAGSMKIINALFGN
eukprot:168165_1